MLQQSIKQAIHLQSTGRSEQAKLIYQEILLDEPDNSTALQNISSIYFREGEKKRAYQILHDLIQKHPYDFSMASNLAIMLHHDEQLDAAINLYEKALTLEPDNLICLRNLFAIKKTTGLVRGAQKYIDQALTSSPNNLPILRLKIELLICNEEFDSALTLCNEVADNHPDDKILKILLGNIHSQQDDHQLALRCFSQALHIDNNCADAHSNMSYSCIQLGQLDTAILHAKTAIGLAPQDSRILSNSSIAFYFNEDFQQAITLCETALRIDPKNTEAKINLVIPYFSTGQLEKGFECAEQRPVKRRSILPPWNRKNLNGSRLLVLVEQGLGDQLQQYWFLPLLIQECEFACIECDERLLPLLMRTWPPHQFPNIGFFCRYLEDQTLKPMIEEARLNCELVVGSLGLRYWPFLTQEYKSNEQLRDLTRPTLPLFKVDEFKSRYWEKYLTKLGCRPKIGVCWRSGLRDNTRDFFYMSVEDVMDIFSGLEIELINLQYECSELELEQLHNNPELNFHDPAGIDLKNHQDNIAALISQLDLVVSAGTATCMLASLLNKPVLAFTIKRRLKQSLCGQESHPLYPQNHYFARKNNEDWEPVKTAIRKYITESIVLPC